MSSLRLFKADVLRMSGYHPLLPISARYRMDRRRPRIAVGMPIAGHPPQSGRIEARTGLRMMPTSPRSPLSSRTAGFPQYGWRDGISDGAFRTRRSAQACSRHTLATYWFASVLLHRISYLECPAQCRVGYAPMHRRGG